MRGSSGDEPTTVSDPLDRSRFPIDEWALIEAEYSTRDLGVTESLFAVGNGYLGMRGNVEEGRETYLHGTFVNGFHETWGIRHAEEAFGFEDALGVMSQGAMAEVAEGFFGGIEPVVDGLVVGGCSAVAASR